MTMKTTTKSPKSSKEDTRRRRPRKSRPKTSKQSSKTRGDGGEQNTSFENDAEGNGEVAATLGHTLDQFAKAIDDLNLEFESSTSKVNSRTKKAQKSIKRSLSKKEVPEDADDTDKVPSNKSASPKSLPDDRFQKFTVFEGYDDLKIDLNASAHEEEESEDPRQTVEKQQRREEKMKEVPFVSVDVKPISSSPQTTLFTDSMTETTGQQPNATKEEKKVEQEEIRNPFDQIESRGEVEQVKEVPFASVSLKPSPRQTPESSPVPEPTSVATPGQNREKRPKKIQNPFDSVKPFDEVEGVKEVPFASINVKSAGVSSSLSELSKQLRMLQARNEAQNVEIDRLERQLCIMSDLQGLVSVNDLRAALESACEAEAYEEMRLQIKRLQADLEVAQASHATTTTGSDSVQKIASLELRIGELEELEQARREENHRLYKQLEVQTARAARLEAQLKARDSITPSENNDQQIVLHPAWVEQQLAEPSPPQQQQEQQLVVVETAALWKDRYEAAEHQQKLRNAQAKARFWVQDERIRDLEQQLSSLYASYQVVQEEHEEEKVRRRKAESFLAEADAQVARQVEDDQQSTRSRPHTMPASRRSHSMASPSPNALPYYHSSSSALVPHSQSWVPTATGTAVPSPSYSPSQPTSDPTIFQVTNGAEELAPLLRGTLLVEEGGGLIPKRWKDRSVALYPAPYDEDGGMLIVDTTRRYRLRPGETTFGRYSRNAAYGMSLRTRRGRNKQHVHLAAHDEGEYQQWKNVLAVCLGVEMDTDDNVVGIETMDDQELVILSVS